MPCLVQIFAPSLRCELRWEGPKVLIVRAGVGEALPGGGGNALPYRNQVTLKTNKTFDGAAKLEAASSLIKAYSAQVGEQEIPLDGTYPLTGGALHTGVVVWLEGTSASKSKDDIVLSLTLSPADTTLQTKLASAHLRLTVVKATLDVCHPRESGRIAAGSKISPGAFLSKASDVAERIAVVVNKVKSHHCGLSLSENPAHQKCRAGNRF